MRPDTISRKMFLQWLYKKKPQLLKHQYPFVLLNYTQRNCCVSYFYEIPILSFVSQPSAVSVQADIHSVCIFLMFGECAFQSMASNESRSHYPEKTLLIWFSN